MKEPDKTESNWKQCVNQLPAFALAGFVPLLCVFAVVFGLNEVFHFSGYSELQESCLRIILCVCVFFFVSLGTFSERLFGWKTVDFTQFLSSSFAAFVVYAIWYSSDSSSQWQDRDGPFFFLWLVLSQLIGTWVWWRIRQLEFPMSSSQPATQFTIVSILCWLTFFGMFIALIQRAPAFPVPFDERLIDDPPVDSIVCAVAMCLFLLPVTRWLLRSRHFLFDVTGVVTICFTMTWILFGLIGLSESSYKTTDAYVERVVTILVAVVAYIFGLTGLRIFLFKRGDRAVRLQSSSRSWRYKAFSIATVLLWSYLGVWGVLSFCVYSQRRSPAWMDKSPGVIAAFEKAHGAEVVERIAVEYRPSRISEWLNHLGCESVPKESNVLYKIASLSKLPLDQDSKVGIEYRKDLGFTPEMVSGLPDETVATWFAGLYEELWDKNHHSDNEVSLFIALQQPDFALQVLTQSQWSEGEILWAADFCRQKKAVFKSIREAIDSSDTWFSPVLASGDLPHSLSIERFASNMIVIETRFAISESRFEDAFGNLESLVSFAVLLRAGEGQFSYSALDIECQVLSILIQIAESAPLSDREIERVESIAEQLDKLAPRSKQREATEIATLVQAMQREFEHLGGSSVLSDRKLLEDFVSAIPQSIDWSVFTRIIIQRDAELRELERNFKGGLREYVEMIESRNQSSSGVRFGSQAIALFSLPSSRSANIANHCFDSHLKKQVKLISENLLHKQVNKVALKLFLYRNRHDKFPLRLSRLEGSCVDPCTGFPLKYYAEGDRFELYSCGENGIDDSAMRWGSDDLQFQWPERTVKGYLKSTGLWMF